MYEYESSSGVEQEEGDGWENAEYDDEGEERRERGEWRGELRLTARSG